MRIGLLTAWANRANGGVFEALVTHARMLKDVGLSPHIFALAHPDDDRDRDRFGNVPVTVAPVIGPRKLGYAPKLANTLISAQLDVLHLHGIWTHVSADGAAWAKRTSRPYFISPHGMLDPWITGLGRPKKVLALHWFERSSWRNATAFHALTQAEAKDINSNAGAKAIAIIPNGIAIPRARSTQSGPPTIVSIGRIHKKKNLVSLIEGWRRAGAGQQGWKLAIAGWGADEDVAALKVALGKHHEADGITVIGPVFGSAKDRLLQSASFVVLPSLSEGLPMAILEAWAAGIPTIMTDASHLPEGFGSGAALWIGTQPAEIAIGLQQAVSMSRTARDTMANAARHLATSRFATDIIAEQWRAFYLGQSQLNENSSI